MNLDPMEEGSAAIMSAAIREAGNASGILSTSIAGITWRLTSTHDPLLVGIVFALARSESSKWPRVQ